MSPIEQLAFILPPLPATMAPPTECPAEIAQLFEHFALELIGAGIKHYSARAIFHRMRWHVIVEKGNRDFKINNNWSAGLARWFMAKHSRAGFFETRGGAEED